MTSHPHQFKFDSVFKDFPHQVHGKYRSVDLGSTTDILPGLQQADPDTFANTAVSIDGSRYAVGHYDRKFGLQSVSKPFVYGMALDDHGETQVRRLIGVESTGTSFNSMIKHEEVSEGRFNPMVNVGAVSTSLIKGDGSANFPTRRKRRCMRPPWTPKPSDK